jgi:hypothetical protein
MTGDKTKPLTLEGAWAAGYRAGNLDGYFGTHEEATNPYTGKNLYTYDEED